MWSHHVFIIRRNKNKYSIFMHLLLLPRIERRRRIGRFDTWLYWSNDDKCAPHSFFVRWNVDSRPMREWPREKKYYFNRCNRANVHFRAKHVIRHGMCDVSFVDVSYECVIRCHILYIYPCHTICTTIQRTTALKNKCQSHMTWIENYNERTRCNIQSSRVQSIDVHSYHGKHIHRPPKINE